MHDDPLHGKVSGTRLNSQANTPVSDGHLELSNVDFVSSSANSYHKGAMLYIFEETKGLHT